VGQPVVVSEKASTAHPGVVRFETNRALTGMGHERYRSVADISGERPPDVLARRLFEQGGIEGVHVNGNVVTVDVAQGHSTDRLRDVIEDLYRFYPDADNADAGEPAGTETEADVGTPAPEMMADTADTPEARTADPPAADPSAGED